MIVCHDSKMVLVQIPHTASTDFAELLINDYGGKAILSKHSYLEELRIFYPSIYKSYFIIGGVRNPLIERVSAYNKLISNHVGLYAGATSSPEIRKARGFGQFRRRKILKEDLSFSNYFLRTMNLIYFSPIYINLSRYDYTYRIENIEQDWEAICNHLSLPIKSIGRKNITAVQSSRLNENVSNVYDIQAQAHATKIFSTFMARFGYSYPDDWYHGRLPTRIEERLSFGARRLMWGVWSIQNSLLHFGK